MPALGDLEIKLRGDAQGWLNATCTYYGLGWLQLDQGRQALKRLMLLMTAHQIGDLDVEQVKAAALLETQDVRRYGLNRSMKTNRLAFQCVS